MPPIIDGSRRVRLDRFDPGDTGGLDKARGLVQLQKLGEELAELTNLLAYAGQHRCWWWCRAATPAARTGPSARSWNTPTCSTPTWCRSRRPPPRSCAHDFLWRVHAHAPALGKLALFNRSHYEDVIAVRVHDLVPPEVWKRRYDHINNFERLLADSKTIVLKFYLHVSPEEQYKRLLEREEDPRTAWKLNVNDWRELPLWKETTKAYEDALQRCSSPELPWYVVPADRKWFRNLAVFERLVLALRPYKQDWLATLKTRRKQALKEIETLRKQMAHELKLPEKLR